MTFNQGVIGPSTRWSEGHSDTRHPYWDVMFPPRDVTGWIDWKRGSTGVAVARRLWHRREYLRRAYESVYGTEPKRWPSRHPRVLLGGNAVSLGCHWLGPGAYAAARRRESSEGAD